MGGDFFKIAQRYVLFELWSFPSASFIRFSDVNVVIEKVVFHKTKALAKGIIRTKQKPKFYKIVCFVLIMQRGVRRLFFILPTNIMMFTPNFVAV